MLLTAIYLKLIYDLNYKKELWLFEINKTKIAYYNLFVKYTDVQNNKFAKTKGAILRKTPVNS